MSTSTEQVVERFIDALGRLEADRELDPIAGMYAEDCTLGNVASPNAFTGPDGAREFWEQYRGVFGDVRSTFRTKVVGDGHAALEWRTEGTLANGSDFRYEGVSMLDVRDGSISRFHAYFDPVKIGIGAGRR